MLLYGPDGSFIRVLHDEIGKREPLETGCLFNAFFLFREQAGLRPFRA
jgi:hypothetical protein